MNRLIFTLIFFLLAGCGDGGEDDCEDAMRDAHNRYGSPEEVNRYSAEGYQKVDYWWWSQGFEISFTWGDIVGECQISSYEFSPIY